MAPEDSHEVLRVPWYSGALAKSSRISLTGLSPSLVGQFRALQLFFRFRLSESYNPLNSIKVWATSLFAHRY